MHPLHDYIARQISERLKDRRIVVMYDPRSELPTFFEEACDGAATALMRTGTFGGERRPSARSRARSLRSARRWSRSPAARTSTIIVVYVPGIARDEKTSLLLEIEKAGDCYLPPAVKQMARNVLRKRFTDVAIDEMLGSDKLTYADLARMTEDTGAADGASLLKSIFGDTDTRATIANWIADESRDSEIDQKGAGGELRRTLQARLGLEMPEGTALAKMRSVAARFVLGNEFRLGLKGPAPASLSTLPAPASREQEAAIQYVAAKMREPRLAAAYERLADQAQAELGLSETSVAGDLLGAVDTFRFEERAVVAKCFELIAKDKSKDAAALLDARSQSFWVDRQPPRKAVWEACRLMIEIGRQADDVVATIAKANGKPEQWIERYVANGPEGWHRFDHAQRRLETLLAAIEDEEVSDVAVARCRAKYDEVARRQAEGFAKVYENAGWTIAGVLPQHRVWAEIVANLPKPLAIVAVDAMRYEIGVELADRLVRSGEVKLRAAIAALPSITPIGMAAILPGAAADFSIAERSGKLGALIGEAFLPDLASRQKYLQAQVPGIVDLTLDDVLTWTKATQKKVAGAQIVFVRSTEIDAAGENTENRYARRIMEGTVGDVARCLLQARGGRHRERRRHRGPWPPLFRGRARGGHADSEPGRRPGRPSPPLLDRPRRLDPAGDREDSGREARIRDRFGRRGPEERLGVQGRRRSRLSPWRSVAPGTRHPCHHRSHEAGDRRRREESLSRSSSPPTRSRTGSSSWRWSLALAPAASSPNPARFARSRSSAADRSPRPRCRLRAPSRAVRCCLSPASP